MAEIRSVVNQVLSQLGTSREARYYLNQYSSDGELQFAVIKVGGAVLEEQLGELRVSVHSGVAAKTLVGGQSCALTSPQFKGDPKEQR